VARAIRTLVEMARAMLHAQDLGHKLWGDTHISLFAWKGFTRSSVDDFLYIKQTSEYLAIVIGYVDDLIILTNTMDKMNEVKAMVNKRYDVCDLNELNYFLGVGLQKQKAVCTITISQSKYIEQVLKCFNM